MRKSTGMRSYFCDETKMMLFYNDGPSRVWRKPLSALEKPNIIPTTKFGKMSLMVWFVSPAVDWKN